jgi:Holliday junction resolvasome RuvABC endonuclease subunit
MDGTILRVMGVDPGSSSLGLTIIDHNIETNTPTLWYTELFQAKTVIDSSPYLFNFPTRGQRLRKCGLYLTEMLEEYQPHLVACEDAYMGRFPTAFRSLSEGIICIQNAVAAWDPFVRLMLVDPPTAKIAVGAPGRGGGKDAVRDAVMANRDFVKEVEVDLLDEHSIDSIAIAYWALQRWREENQF